MRRLNIAVCGLIFAAATATLVSCQDIVTYNDGYDDGMTSNGVPSISAIYRADDTEMTAPLTGAAFEDMIKLTGENLSHTRKVMLNDVEVALSEVYATANAVYFPTMKRNWEALRWILRFRFPKSVYRDYIMSSPCQAVPSR